MAVSQTLGVGWEGGVTGKGMLHSNRGREVGEAFCAVLKGFGGD